MCVCVSLCVSVELDLGEGGRSVSVCALCRVCVVSK